MYTITLIQTEKAGVESWLYASSNSPAFHKTVRLSRIILVLFVILMAGLFLAFNKMISLAFIIVGGIACLIFPRFQRWYYKNYTTRLLRSNEYKNQIGQQYTIQFHEKHLEITGASTVVKHTFENFAGVNETSEYIFIKLIVGHYLVFPKDQLVDINDFRNYLKSLCAAYNITYTPDDKWVW
jgi:hypothetical protein